MSVHAHARRHSCVNKTRTDSVARRRTRRTTQRHWIVRHSTHDSGQPGTHLSHLVSRYTPVTRRAHTWRIPNDRTHQRARRDHILAQRPRCPTRWVRTQRISDSVAARGMPLRGMPLASRSASSCSRRRCSCTDATANSKLYLPRDGGGDAPGERAGRFARKGAARRRVARRRGQRSPPGPSSDPHARKRALPSLRRERPNRRPPRSQAPRCPGPRVRARTWL